MRYEKLFTMLSLNFELKNKKMRGNDETKYVLKLLVILSQLKIFD